MSDYHVDIAVIGAGPAGLSAAIAAAKAGASVIAFDENGKPGGQLFKQTHKFFGSRSHLAGIRGFDIGNMLLEECDELGVAISLDTVVNGLFEGNLLEIVRGGKKLHYQARSIIVTAGAVENSIAFPGWDLPGVMGAGAAQTMINVNRVLPGQKVLIVGSGNVGLIVGYQLKQSGATVVGIVEAAPKIGGYGVHSGKVLRAGIPIYLSTTVKEAHGSQQVEGATIVSLDKEFNPLAGTERELDVDTICIAAGLTPMSELARMLDVEQVWESRLGGHIPMHNSDMLTSRPSLYVAGDVAGVEEASTAIEEGRMAGVSASAALGYLSEEEARVQKAQINERLNILRSGAFGLARRQAKEKIFALYEKMYGGANAAQSGCDAGLTPTTVENRVCYRGYPSLPEIEASGNMPSEQRFAKGPVAIVECVQEIPCNPCEESCPFKAIRIGSPITNLPALDFDLCTGCGQCICGCPGQAIFTVDMSKEGDCARVKIPWEYLPYPQQGDKVDALNRQGETIGSASVHKVINLTRYDKTCIVEIEVDKKIAMETRSIRA